MKLLLHICCAPCLIFPLERLKLQNFEVNGYFYNPNIHPLGEYENRKEALTRLCANLNVNIDYPVYEPQDFFQAVKTEEIPPKRCSLCWALRLGKTARIAKEKGFTHFSTTLLVSPYQSQELLKSLGEKIAQETSINFYYEDFRPGFRKAHQQARAQGIYCQKYCGCVYSETEKHRNKINDKCQNPKFKINPKSQ